MSSFERICAKTEVEIREWAANHSNGSLEFQDGLVRKCLELQESGSGGNEWLIWLFVAGIIVSGFTILWRKIG